MRVQFTAEKEAITNPNFIQTSLKYVPNFLQVTFTALGIGFGCYIAPAAATYVIVEGMPVLYSLIQPAGFVANQIFKIGMYNAMGFAINSSYWPSVTFGAGFGAYIGAKAYDATTNVFSYIWGQTCRLTSALNESTHCVVSNTYTAIVGFHDQGEEVLSRSQGIFSGLLRALSWSSLFGR